MSYVRSEISKKNKYWIDKNRYHELKHFCLQYPIWKKECKSLDGYHGRFLNPITNTNIYSDSISKTVEARFKYLKLMEKVEQAAIKTDPYLASYILKAVTEGYSYNYLRTTLQIPCGKDMYYNRYRRFFWILDSLRE